MDKKSTNRNQQETITQLAYKKQEGNQDNGIDGIYNLVATVMGKNQKGMLSVLVEGNALKGTIDIMNSRTDIEEGKINGNSFEFSIPARGDKLKINGTIINGELTGTAKLGVMKMKMKGEQE